MILKLFNYTLSLFSKKTGIDALIAEVDGSYEVKGFSPLEYSCTNHDNPGIYMDVFGRIGKITNPSFLLTIVLFLAHLEWIKETAGLTGDFCPRD